MFLIMQYDIESLCMYIYTQYNDPLPYTYIHCQYTVKHAVQPIQCFNLSECRFVSTVDPNNG